MNTNNNDGEKKCFVVMPFGKNKDEKKWYRAWYQEVIEPSVTDAGYTCILAAQEEQPGAINDEIRYHLAKDHMVVVDLGGIEPINEPNPNVMYELGIRHAFDMPVVLMAWEGQIIPFDVSNQRIITSERHPINFSDTRKKLKNFIKAAEDGNYYRPMEAVKRATLLENASSSLTEENVLHVLIDEIQNLQRKFSHNSVYKRPKLPSFKNTLWKSKAERKKYYELYLLAGCDQKNWSKILSIKIDQSFIDKCQSWDDEEWMSFFMQECDHINDQEKFELDKSSFHPRFEEIIQKVQEELPQQPWPKGTHTKIIKKLGITTSQYQRSVSILINRGIFKRQEDGILYDDE